MHTHPNTYHPVLLVLLALGLYMLYPVGPVAAQNIGENPAVQDYGRPGMPRITVYVWGNAQTGVWTIEEGASLLEVVSATSRVRLEQRNPEERQIRTLRLYREGNRSGDPAFEARLEDVFSRRVELPELRNRDVLVIETRARRRLSWRDVNQLAGTVASVLSVFILIDRLDSNN